VLIVVVLVFITPRAEAYVGEAEALVIFVRTSLVRVADAGFSRVLQNHGASRGSRASRALHRVDPLTHERQGLIEDDALVPDARWDDHRVADPRVLARVGDGLALSNDPCEGRVGRRVCEGPGRGGRAMSVRVPRVAEDVREDIAREALDGDGTLITRALTRHLRASKTELINNNRTRDFDDVVLMSTSRRMHLHA
jgi:hypothetical protein